MIHWNSPTAAGSPLKCKQIFISKLMFCWCYSSFEMSIHHTWMNPKCICAHNYSSSGATLEKVGWLEITPVTHDSREGVSTEIYLSHLMWHTHTSGEGGYTDMIGRLGDNLAPRTIWHRHEKRTIWHRHEKRTIWHRNEKGQFGTAMKKGQFGTAMKKGQFGTAV